jgi:hypothetical protein
LSLKCFPKHDILQKLQRSLMSCYSDKTGWLCNKDVDGDLIKGGTVECLARFLLSEHKDLLYPKISKN